MVSNACQVIQVRSQSSGPAHAPHPVCARKAKRPYVQSQDTKHQHHTAVLAEMRVDCSFKDMAKVRSDHTSGRLHAQATVLG